MLSATLRFSRQISPLVSRNLAGEYSLKSVRRLSKIFKMTESATPWLNIDDSDSKEEKKQGKVSKKKSKNKGSNGTKEKQQKLQVTTNIKNADSKKGNDSVRATVAGAASSSAEKDLDMDNHSDTTNMNGEVQANISTTPKATEETQQTSSDDDFQECEETELITEVKSSNTTTSSCENQASTTSPQTTADEQSTPETKDSKKKKKKKKKKDKNLDNTEAQQQKMAVKEETGAKREEPLDQAHAAATTVAKMQHEPPHDEDKRQGQSAQREGRQDNSKSTDAMVGRPGGHNQSHNTGPAATRQERGRITRWNKPTDNAAPIQTMQDKQSGHSADAASNGRKGEIHFTSSADPSPTNKSQKRPFESPTSSSESRLVGPRLHHQGNRQQGFQWREFKNDLFRCSPKDSMAQGVSQDFNMGRGLAKIFKDYYNGVEELKAQGRKVGEVAVMPVQGQYIYYLITKEKFSDKPTYEALQSSLEAMRRHCQDNGVTSIAMPQIGCGRDGLQWNTVARMVKDVFKSTSISITVYAQPRPEPVGFVLDEVEGDLFECSPSDSMAHCVSQDLQMGKGIAVTFKKKYGGVDHLRAQGKQVGDVAVLPWDGQYIYYLITKEQHFDKPTYETLRSSLQAMRNHCLENKVTRLAMPQIGCGLDKLQWNRVLHILCEEFKNTGITITVYCL